jgi:hypothetical protein
VDSSRGVRCVVAFVPVAPRASREDRPLLSHRLSVLSDLTAPCENIERRDAATRSLA